MLLQMIQLAQGEKGSHAQKGWPTSSSDSEGAIMSVTHSSSYALQLSCGMMELLFDLPLCHAAISLPQD